MGVSFMTSFRVLQDMVDKGYIKVKAKAEAHTTYQPNNRGRCRFP